MSGSMYGDNNPINWLTCIDSDNSETGAHSDFGGHHRYRAPDLSQRLRKLYKNSLYTDVKFVINCGIKPKPELRAHKAILAIGSEEFAKLFFGKAPQDSGKPTVSEYEIKNISFRAFKNVVEYLYYDDVYFEDNLIVMQTMAAARKFQVQSLVDRCEFYLESIELSDENVTSVYQTAIENKIESLKTRCSQFIQENTRYVIRSDDFKNSNLSTVRSICKLPRLNLSSEEELFESVVEWANSQPGSRVSKREVLLPLLKTVHFLSVPAMKFTEIVNKCPDVFTAEEAMHVVMHLANPNPSTEAKLPSWFNKGPDRCFTAPQAKRAQPVTSAVDKKLTISLRPFPEGCLSTLKNVLELKCLEGHHHIKALKLTFGDPVTEKSSISHLIITAACVNNNYTFQEHIKIQNSKEIVVSFTQSLLIYAGQIVRIEAEAKEVKNYKFLQFDEQNSLTERRSFECKLGSFPKQNRLFFINEVIYKILRPREKSRGSRNSRRVKQTEW